MTNEVIKYLLDLGFECKENTYEKTYIFPLPNGEIFNNKIKIPNDIKCNNIKNIVKFIDPVLERYNSNYKKITTGHKKSFKDFSFCDIQNMDKENCIVKIFDIEEWKFVKDDKGFKSIKRGDIFMVFESDNETPILDRYTKESIYIALSDSYVTHGKFNINYTTISSQINYLNVVADFEY